MRTQAWSLISANGNQLRFRRSTDLEASRTHVQALHRAPAAGVKSRHLWLTRSGYGYRDRSCVRRSDVRGVGNLHRGKEETRNKEHRQTLGSKRIRAH